jgi:NitT/TauT family transport system substrate-binding protein
VDMGADQLPIDFAWGSQQAAIFEKIEAYLVNAGQISSPIAPTDLFTNAYAAQYNQFDHSIIVNQARNWK